MSKFEDRIKKLSDAGGTVCPVMFPGMSLRDWFAGQALAGHLASYAHPNSAGTSQDTPEKQAAWAYGFADAMIAERSK